MPTIDDVLTDITPKTKRVRVCLRGDLLQQLDDLDVELQQAVLEDRTQNRAPLAPQIADRIAAVRREAEAAEVEFVFQAVGRRAWSDLMVANPPTPEQQAEVAERGGRYEWNPETFPMAAVAASCVEPTGMTVEKVEQLYARLNDGQWLRLWKEGCLGANVTGTDIPFSAAAYAVRRVSETSTEQPATTDSHAASS